MSYSSVESSVRVLSKLHVKRFDVRRLICSGALHAEENTDRSHTGYPTRY